MADRRGNVIVLPGRGGAGQVQRDHLEALRAIVGQLDELRQRLQEFSPRPGWSAKRWMIASTPFRMRLTGANRGLGDLTRLNASSEQSAIRSVFQLNDACRAASQRLHDIEACLGMLQSAEAPPAERARETDLFASSRSGLLAALSEIRRLIVQRFPDVLVENLWKSSGTAGGTRGGARDMALAGDPGSTAVADQQPARSKLEDELRSLDERLRVMLDAYEENPSAIDSGLLSVTDRAEDVEAAIIDAYRIMKTRVYAEDSPLRADHDVWAAFEEQKDEFIGFYKSALTALEIYREVLRTYSLLKTTAEPQPQR